MSRALKRPHITTWRNFPPWLWRRNSGRKEWSPRVGNTDREVRGTKSSWRSQSVGSTALQGERTLKICKVFGWRLASICIWGNNPQLEETPLKIRVGAVPSVHKGPRRAPFPNSRMDSLSMYGAWVRILRKVLLAHAGGGALTWMNAALVLPNKA